MILDSHQRQIQSFCQVWLKSPLTWWSTISTLREIGFSCLWRNPIGCFAITTKCFHGQRKRKLSVQPTINTIAESRRFKPIRQRGVTAAGLLAMAASIALSGIATGDERPSRTSADNGGRTDPTSHQPKWNDRQERPRKRNQDHESKRHWWNRRQNILIRLRMIHFSANPLRTLTTNPRPSEVRLSYRQSLRLPPFPKADSAVEIDSKIAQATYENVQRGGTPIGGCQKCGGRCGGTPACGRTWVQAEYLLWTLSGFQIPALVTTSEAGTPRDQAGILGQPGTHILFGNSTVVDQARSGGRFSVGRVLDSSGCKSIELNYFSTGKATDSFSANSTGNGILARPFFSVEPGAVGPNAELISFPGILEGSVSATTESEFQGGGILFHQMLSRGKCRQIRLFAGYNYNELEESVTISDFKRALDASLGLAVGTTIRESDRSSTSNRMNSFVVGTDIRAQHCRWSVDLMMQLALGQTVSKATLNGSTTTSVPIPGGTDVNTIDSGLLVLASNRGSYETDDFSVMPQLGLMSDINSHLGSPPTSDTTSSIGAVSLDLATNLTPT